MTVTPTASATATAKEPLLLGVRHHGPGSARAVRAALEAARPAAVLIEGPPEGDALLPLAADPGMRPPVALLAHAAADPGRAAFWPLAEFSPEWVAIRWAQEAGVPVRFIDLPAAHSLAAEDDPRPPDSDGPGGPDTPDAVRLDPLAVLAETAGYEDPERWWEDVVEHRGTGTADPVAAFEALGEAMAALREAYGDGGHARDLLREAYMRQKMRAARREFSAGYAVVCGAWHVPALRAKTTAAADRSLLAGLPKVKVETAWVPWTHRRLARAGGYGAGITSPGWYGHLFGAVDRPVERWLTKIAGLLRAEDRQVSSAHVIEAVRLADTLAAMRGRPLPGLSETLEAARAVMCDGSDVPLALIEDRLVVGDVLGEVPETAPAVPLQRDLTRLQRSLRLKPEAQDRELELDLRKDTDAAKSRLLHRLRLLGVDWGRPAVSRGSTGTFRETWRLRWEPELSVRVAEAGIWGTTVAAAATARAEADAAAAGELGEVTSLAERCLLAGLPEALPAVLKALADRAALDTDVARLARALPALARSLRYGDVRGTDTAALGTVAAGLAERICVALPPACAAGLDADAAAELRDHVDAVHGAIALLGPARPPAAEAAPEAQAGGPPAELPEPGAPMAPDAEPPAGPADGSTAGGSGAVGPADPGLRGRWAAVLGTLAGREAIPGLIRGRAARLLLDDGRLAPEETARLMGLALSPAAGPVDAAGWIEGFAGGGAGGGTLLVHDERLLRLIDTWLTGIPAGAFTDVLPLLRRTFGAYEPGVRRSLGELVRRGPGGTTAGSGSGQAPEGFAPELDRARADAVIPLVRLLLAAGAGAGSGAGAAVPAAAAG
ncbi:DUF5682 family protein [Streptomyces sp. NPDC051211]|uniref:DUF5682 family protein n=1 Tax=Streptomyces sp. NPDC051211 TaxID=3154643 RepID=UPI00344B64E6